MADPVGSERDVLSDGGVSLALRSLCFDEADSWLSDLVSPGWWYVTLGDSAVGSNVHVAVGVCSDIGVVTAVNDTYSGSGALNSRPWMCSVPFDFEVFVGCTDALGASSFGAFGTAAGSNGCAVRGPINSHVDIGDRAAACRVDVGKICHRAVSVESTEDAGTCCYRIESVLTVT